MGHMQPFKDPSGIQYPAKTGSGQSFREYDLYTCGCQCVCPYLRCIYYYNSIVYYMTVMKITMVCKFLIARNVLKTMKYIQHQLCKKKKNS